MPCYCRAFLFYYICRKYRNIITMLMNDFRHYFDKVMSDLEQDTKVEFNITDCFRLSNECMDFAVATMQKGNEVLSDDYLKLARDFALLREKYNKVFEDNSEDFTEQLYQHLQNNSSGAFVVGDNTAQKDALVKEFNSLYARYKALGDFK